VIYSPTPLDYDKQVVVFVHVPKTAGSSLTHLFADAFGPQAHVSLRAQKLERPFSNRFERAFTAWRHRVYGAAAQLRGSHWLLDGTVDRSGAVRFVSGHAALGAAPCFGKAPVAVTLVRDPADRFISEYFFYQDLKEGDASGGRDRQPARRLDLDTYVRKIVEGSILRSTNLHCRYLGGTEFFVDAKAAVDRRLFLAAPVARIDDFVAMLSAPFGIAARAAPARNLGKARRRAERPIAPQTLAMIEDLVSEDRKLFNYVQDEFERIHRGQMGG
jgi:hypothetical protein